MAYDFKKEEKKYYLPKRKPEIIEIPAMKFIIVSGQGDPNKSNGEYQKALSQLYTMAYTIKMSKMGDHCMDGYFDFVVPPLEGFWWQKDKGEIDFQNKDNFQWISMIRVPYFVNEQELDWAKSQALAKKKIDCSKVQLLDFKEGLCAQVLHVGSYDDEPATIQVLDDYIRQQGYMQDFNENRHHHEIYLSDPRRTAPEKLKTVIRHPIRKAD
ncbi:GyrI-like domain-containing protein [Erysipelotrichaceae bacterium RD49]|nr:GyrI-like domain-containing protein [Erysipelotrichaceae bacterium RD49]